jgi:hypothetical protein
LVILASIVVGAFVFSTILYIAFYYFLIPLAEQEAPLHFQLQKMTKMGEN